MPVEIIVNNREFKNQYDNGQTYGDNPSEFTVNLAGSVMEKIEATNQFDISWYFQATSSNPIDYEDLGSDEFKYRKANGGSFIDDGFSIGDTLQWSFPSGGSTTTRQGTVDNITPTWIYITYTTPTTLTPAVGQSTGSLFQGTSDLTSLIYNFGLIQNTENFNTISKVSSNDQAYYSTGITEGGGTVPMIKQFQYGDWVTGSATVERVANPSTFVQRFIVVHEFIINPYYLDGQLSNLENDVVPSLLAGLNSLRYVFRIDARTALSNPNSSKKATEEQQLGSVAWFNENFNGFENIYSATAPTYQNTVTSDFADGLLIGAKTKVELTISKSSGAFVSTDKIGAYVSYLPPSIQYTNLLTTLQQNFMYGNGHSLADGAAGTFDGVVTRIEANLSGGDIILDFDVQYDFAQAQTLATSLFADNDPRFLIAIQVGDITIIAGDSDKVMLISDVGLYDDSADISGLFDINKSLMFKHNKVIGVDAGTSNVIAYNEDGVAWDVGFTLNLNKSAVLKTLDLVEVLYNSTTEQFFKLDQYAIGGVSGAPTFLDSGFTVQSLEFTGTRGYLLEAGSQFNDVILTTTTLAAGLQGYDLTIPQKITWQDWIAKANINNVFFDATKPNNNLNLKSSNYSNISGYLMHFGLLATVEGTNGLGNTADTDYLALSNDFLVHDYDFDPTGTWTATIETFTEDGVTNLGGGILPDQDTLFRITWDAVAPVTSIVNTWTIHRIEETLQAGFAIEECSNINPVPVNQILKPIVGETQLKLTIVGDNIQSECLIDYTKLVAGVSYNLSGRLEGVPS